MLSIRMDFKTDKNNKVVMEKDEAVIRTCIERILLTEAGENPFEPVKGIGMTAYISSLTNFFALMSLKVDLAQGIRRELGSYIAFDDSDLIIEVDENKLKIYLEYTWLNDKSEDKVVLTI